LILEIKTGTIAMPLIEEKTGFGFALVHPDKGCAHCVNVATVGRNILRHGRNETAKLASPLHNRADHVLKIIWCHNNFPEIKSSEVREPLFQRRTYRVRNYGKKSATFY
jgi:hypothetical protein